MAIPKRKNPNLWSNYEDQDVSPKDPIIETINRKSNISSVLELMPTTAGDNVIEAINNWIPHILNHIRPIRNMGELNHGTVAALCCYIGGPALETLTVERAAYHVYNLELSEAITRLRSTSRISVRGANMANLLQTAKSK